MCDRIRLVTKSNAERQSDYRARQRLADAAAAGQQSLVELPTPRRGRPPVGDRPMTPAERKARSRAKAKAKREAQDRAEGMARAAQVRQPPGDPAQVLARWCAERLVVPPGHALAGQPMALPIFALDWLAEALAPDAKKSLLSVARKNAKSAIIATYLLCRLAGPLAYPGYRAGVCSVSKPKAGELKRQMQEIAEASGLEGLRFMRSPAPGRVEAPGGTVEILAADESSGHASGFDDAIVDELGLLEERHRALVNGMVSATSAKNGRFLSISIQGAAPFTRELIEQRNAPGIVVHHYAAPDGCDLDDLDAWRAANPGLGTIKSMDYMRQQAADALAIPANQSFFRAHDLNQPVAPDQQTIIPLSDWLACEGQAERRGPVVIGLDLGGTRSMCALVAYWLETGRLEAWGAFGDNPTLAARGKADGVGGDYEALHKRGELWTYPGRVTPVDLFLADCMTRLHGQRVVAAGADRYRQGEALDALEAGLAAAREQGTPAKPWPMSWRGTGAGKHAQGTADVRAFQRRAAMRQISWLPGHALMAQAIGETKLRLDPAGNPALDKARGNKSRIDAVQAAVIACGLADEAQRANKGKGKATRLRIVR